MNIGRRAWFAALLVLLALPLGSACVADGREEPTITISTAASLLPAFEEIGDLFTDETGIQVLYNAGATAQLAQQIQNGAPVDLFAAADAGDIERLVADGDLLAETITSFAEGRLIVWSQEGSLFEIRSLDDLTQPEIERIAIANPDIAPYGRAAREALEQTGIWQEVQPKLVYAENVRQALQYAETGAVDAAIVALSLSQLAKGNQWLIPANLHDPLRQTIALVATTRNRAAALDFVAFLGTPRSRAILQKYGYTLPAAATD